VATKRRQDARRQWAAWLMAYGAARLFDSMMQTVQGARSVCVFCGQSIECDIVEGGGVPDWKTHEGDYGCSNSPDTTEEGSGGHAPTGSAEARRTKSRRVAR
jgi:hypothetical protein